MANGALCSYSCGDSCPVESHRYSERDGDICKDVGKYQNLALSPTLFHSLSRGLLNAPLNIEASFFKNNLWCCHYSYGSVLNFKKLLFDTSGVSQL